MKNLLTIFLLGLFLAIPVTVSARKTIYVRSTGTYTSPVPRRDLFLNAVLASADQETEEVIVTFNTVLTNVRVTLYQNSTIVNQDILSTTVEGQTVPYNVGNYTNGEYTLLIVSEEEIIGEYIVEITD